MKVELPLILWHGKKQRILSLDFHPFTNELVTGGSDEYNPDETSDVDGYAKLWELVDSKDVVAFKYGLKEHQSNVNCVKFSPDGRYLATGSDDKTIIIWQIRENFMHIGTTQRCKKWSHKIPLTGHLSEVLDLKWSTNSKYLVSAGMDKRIIVWHVEKKRYERILEEHSKFVQGVAIDPKFKYIVSVSNDRSVKIWKNAKTKKTDVAFYSMKTHKKMDFGGSKEKEEEKSDQNFSFKMFYDENVPTFFRRPDISPDGQLFLVPAGQWQKSPESQPQNCAFIFRRKFLEKPCCFIETHGQPSVCARFCPTLFQKQDPQRGIFKQPYYMVFAIGTFTSVLVYNTENLSPMYAVGNYHLASITEISWKNSSILGMSSSDGYCSFMTFEKGQLGNEYQVTDESLKALLAREKYEQKEQIKQALPENNECRVVMKEGEGNQVKKMIIPKVIDRF